MISDSNATISGETTVPTKNSRKKTHTTVPESVPSQNLRSQTKVNSSLQGSVPLASYSANPESNQPSQPELRKSKGKVKKAATQVYQLTSAEIPNDAAGVKVCRDSSCRRLQTIESLFNIHRKRWRPIFTSYGGFQMQMPFLSTHLHSYSATLRLVSRHQLKVISASKSRTDHLWSHRLWFRSLSTFPPTVVANLQHPSSGWKSIYLNTCKPASQNLACGAGAPTFVNRRTASIMQPVELLLSTLLNKLSFPIHMPTSVPTFLTPRTLHFLYDFMIISSIITSTLATSRI